MTRTILVLITILIQSVAYAESGAASTKVLEVKVTENGFEPSTLSVSPGSQVTLNVTRTTDATCAKKIVFKNLGITKDLPLNKMVSINLGKITGTEVAFACGMKMLTGHIVVR